MFVNLEKEMVGRNHMTRKDLAIALGLSEKTISNKMNGKTDFTYSEMVKIRSLLGKSLDELFQVDEHKSA